MTEAKKRRSDEEIDAVVEALRKEAAYWNTFDRVEKRDELMEFLRRRVVRRELIFKRAVVRDRVALQFPDYNTAYQQACRRSYIGGVLAAIDYVNGQDNEVSRTALFLQEAIKQGKSVEEAYKLPIGEKK